jgi:acyl carrier protein
MFKRTKTSTIDGPLTEESLRSWLVADLARRVKCAESEIDTAKPFDAFGLDSRTAVQVSGALEKVVERRLSPAILFDHGTIDDLAAYLSRELHLPD